MKWTLFFLSALSDQTVTVETELFFDSLQSCVIAEYTMRAQHLQEMYAIKNKHRLYLDLTNYAMFGQDARSKAGFVWFEKFRADNADALASEEGKERLLQAVRRANLDTVQPTNIEQMLALEAAIREDSEFQNSIALAEVLELFDLFDNLPQNGMDENFAESARLVRGLCVPYAL